MKAKQRLHGIYDDVLDVDHVHFDRAFTVLLLLFIGTLLASTPQYRDDSQLFPLVIGIPTFLLLLFLLVVQVSTRFNRKIERYATSNLFDLDEVVSDMDRSVAGGGATRRSLPEKRKNVLSISLWTLALFGIILLVGFLPGTLIFLLAFYRFHAGQNWFRTLAYSLVMWLFVVVIFEIVLNTPFYTGLLGVELPLPF